MKRELVLTLIGTLMMARMASAQVTPAAGFTPPDDTPSISVGATIFADYSYTSSPQKTDSDGNLYHPSAFNVTRSYVNINGKISHLVAFRITPDITRASNGDLSLRLKYAFAQVNFDDWMPKGSWMRFGQQQTPLVDYEEGIYRYRFQGTTFTEREGYLTSSDLGASFHGNVTNNYGDIHVGVYNGEGYHAVEANDQPSFQMRGTVRPFAKAAPVARGLRLTGFYDADNYVKNGEKKRALFEASFEHQYLNIGVRLPGHEGSAVGDGGRRAWQGVVVLVHASLHDRVGGPDSATITSRRTPRLPRRCTTGPWLASRTGSRTRAVPRRRSCSTTTTPSSRTSRAAGTEADRRARVDQLLRSGTGTVVTLEEDR